MHEPFQCIEWACSSRAGQGVLLAASGSTLYAYDLEKAVLASQWPADTQPEEHDEGSQSSTEIITTSNEDRHRAKRRIKAKAAGKAAQGHDGISESPDINLLRLSNDQRHVALITGADKTLHILKLGEDGTLVHLCRRQMAKRPCAIAFDSHGDSILCGDKFGDVYSLPLHEDEDNKFRAKTSQSRRPRPENFQPSATDLTVHTGRNLKTLEAQQKATLSKSTPKEVMEFSHELLLGHVSMLTDICSVKLDVRADSTSSVSATPYTRHYIVTADRDEHVRVSRGQPQAHIIESYCFGHKQFVNKLCHVRPEILVSGGGDDYLFVWNWRQGDLICKLDLRQATQQLRKTQDLTRHADNDVKLEAAATSDNLEDPLLQPPNMLLNGSPIAVCGIWVSPDDFRHPSDLMSIFCACEGVPAIFHYWHIFQPEKDNVKSLKETGLKLQILPLDGNPVDVTTRPTSFIVSVDTVHECGSTDRVRKTPTPSTDSKLAPRLFGFDINLDIDSRSASVVRNFKLQQNLNEFEGCLSNKSRNVNTSEKEANRVRELIYTSEKLRKRGNEDNE